MKGDLHTLKKVCLYGYKTMSIGMVVIGAIIAMMVILGCEALAMDSDHELLQSILSVDFDNDSAIVCVSSFAEVTLIFVLAFITVFCIRALMVSIHSEHSPFTDDNVHIVKFMAFLYLGASVVFALLELIGKGGPASAAFMLFGCILISVVLYILALVVRYGAVLQNESDHTL